MYKETKRYTLSNHQGLKKRWFLVKVPYIKKVSVYPLPKPYFGKVETSSP